MRQHSTHAGRQGDRETTAAGETISVLVVDDQRQYVDVVSQHLELEEDMTAHTAVDPETALEELADHEIDCVISDYRMGRMDGIELMRAVRDQAGEDLPFILATGAGSEDVASEAISAGVTDYVRKGRGQHRDLLINRIRNAVRRYRTQTVANQYQSIVDALDAPSFTVDTDGEVVFADGSLSEMTGYDTEDLLGSHYDRFLTDHDDVLSTPVERLVGAEDPPIRVEATVATATGGRIPCEILLGPVREGGAFVGYAGILQDITERIERERELEEYERIVENTTDAIAIKDETGEYLLANQAMGDLLSIDPGGIVGRTDETLYDPSTASTFRRHEQQTLDSDSVQETRDEVTVDGERRTFQTTRIPHVRPDGDGRSVIVIHRDVTEVRRHERRLTKIHEVSQDLLTATGEDEIAARLATAATDVESELGVTVYLYDSSANSLVPTATSGQRVGGARTAVEPSDSPVWQSFIEESTVYVDDAGESTTAAGTEREAGLAIPVGGHGVLHVRSDSVIPEGVIELMNILAATAESVLDRTTQLETVRERERTLENRNDRLDRLETLSSVLTDVTRTALRDDLSTGVLEAVCERLTDDDGVQFAWVGRRTDAEELVPAAWAGTGQHYLDAPLWDLTKESLEPAGRAAVEGRTVQVQHVAESPRRAEWRGTALTHGFQSVLAVPIALGDASLGVLGVYGDDPDAFSDTERSLVESVARLLGERLTDLGQAAVSLPGPLDELEVRVTESGSPLATLARTLDSAVEVDSYDPDDGEVAVEFRVPDEKPATVRAAAEGVVGLSGVESDDDGHEATLSTSSLPLRLAVNGAVIESVRHTSRETRVELFAPGTGGRPSGVRSVLDSREDVELVSRRSNVVIGDGTGAGSPLESLTQRQQEVLQTAHEAGFFEWPRETNGDEVADQLGIAAPTFHEHIRRAERGLIEQMKQ